MLDHALDFTVPGAPKGKARPRVTRSGHAFTPAKTVVYENSVRLHFSEKYPDHIPLEGPIIATIDAAFPIPKSWSKKKRDSALNGWIRPTVKPDTDNIAKSILDSLNTIAYRDDSQIVGLCVQKVYGLQPGVRVRLMYGETTKQ